MFLTQLIISFGQLFHECKSIIEFLNGSPSPKCSMYKIYNQPVLK